MSQETPEFWELLATLTVTQVNNLGAIVGKSLLSIFSVLLQFPSYQGLGLFSRGVLLLKTTSDPETWH